MTLGEKQPVEGVPGRRFRIERVKDVGDFDIEDLQTTRFDVCRHVRQGHADIQFAEPAFDRYFPKSGNADEAYSVPDTEVLADSRKLQIEIPPQKAEENMGIQQQALH